jgi:hypothetical protein
MANSLGEVAGPVLGGIGYETFGFAGECLGVAIVTGAYGMLIAAALAARLVPKSGAWLGPAGTSVSYRCVMF